MSAARCRQDLAPLVAMTLVLMLEGLPGKRWEGEADDLKVELDRASKASLRARPGWPATGGTLATLLERGGRHLLARRLIYRRSALGARRITLSLAA